MKSTTWIIVLTLVGLVTPIRAAAETAGVPQRPIPKPENYFQPTDPAHWVQTSGDPASLFVHWTSFKTTTPAHGEPPDSYGAVGPDGVLSSNNREFKYSRRDGAFVWSNDRIFPPRAQRALDPRAIYDRLSERFFIFGSETTPEGQHYRGYLNVAVSKTSNPTTSDTASWRFYRIGTTEVVAGDTLFMDLPTIGIDDVGVYASLNMFHVPPGSIPFNNAAFRHCRVLIFDKADLLSGTVDLHAVNTPDGSGNGFALQPVNLIASPSALGKAWLVETPFGSSTSVRVWAIVDPFGTPSLQSVSVTVPSSGGSSNDAPQSGSDLTIDTQSPRTQGDAFQRKGKVWFCHTAGGFSRSNVFYYCLDLNGFPSGSPSLIEAGSIDGGSGIWNCQPAINGNDDGEVAIVFTQTSAGMFPRIMATMRAEEDSTFSTPVVVIESETYYVGEQPSRQRWGDYAAVAVDPIDQTFWVTHEWAHDEESAFNWACEWGQILAPDVGPGWPDGGRVVRATATEVGSVFATSDGSSGTIAAWSDGRLYPAIYVQRIENDGAIGAGWKQGGMLPFVFSGSAEVSALFPSVASDFDNGAFVGWNGLGIRVQRVAAGGAIATGWSASGVPLASGGSNLTLDSSPSSGAVASWKNSGVRVNRISLSGTLDWGTNGVQVATSGNNPIVAADGKDGAIVAWAGLRLQRVSAAGAIVWTSGGINPDSGTPLDIVSDGLGGATVTYVKSNDLYAIRVDSTGAVVSGWNPVAVCTASGVQLEAQMIKDSAGGVLIAWSDTRGGSADVYASRIASSGSRASGWPSNGLLISGGAGDEFAPMLASDGADGAVIAWQDTRDDDSDIYCTAVSASAILDSDFPTYGLGVAVQPGVQGSPTIVPSGSGEAIICWADGRLFPAEAMTHSVFAQRVNLDGEMLRVASASPMTSVRTLLECVPNPAKGSCQIRLALPVGMAGVSYEIEAFDIQGRRVAIIAKAAAQGTSVVADWNFRSSGSVSAGVYHVVARAGGEKWVRRVLVLP